MKRNLLLLTGLVLSIFSFGQHTHTHLPQREIEFPDVPGYQTLVCDFHQHTVFSDGKVWPSVRVEEALRDSLDAISLTEHLEYQPHLDDIPHPDRNRAFFLARDFAKAFDLIVVSGAEITRDMPPGHCNAIFIEDANKLLIDDPLEVFREAKRQGAFVFWNHPNWTAQVPDGVARLTELHQQLLAEDLIHGIEVVNEHTYSSEALWIALENDLTIMGTSDIHGLIDWQFEVPQGGHRPVTLVFAEERSEAAIKEALLARRTVAWFNNLLIGREEHLAPLLKQSLKVVEAAYQPDTQLLSVKIDNCSDADFQLQNLSAYTLHASSDVITIPAHSVTELQIKTLERLEYVSMAFRVLNAVMGPSEHPIWNFEVDIVTE